MSLAVLGIDVGKRQCHAALLQGGKVRQKAFANTADGFVRLRAWLERQGIETLHACMEATGAFGDALASFLHDQGYVVSVVNPVQIKGFAKSELSRSKTDPIDAGIIARFCMAMKPRPWQPPSPEVMGLRAWMHRLWALEEMRQMEANRLKAGNVPSAVVPSLEALIAYLEAEMARVKQQIKAYVQQHPKLKQQSDLLVTIPGIGELTAWTLLAEIPDITAFSSARHLAAFAGLTPREKQSGTSVKGKPRLCKIGNGRIRKGLYMPAVVARSCNPAIRLFSKRLAVNGKCKMAIIGACMRKLLHLAYGVLKSGKPFDPGLATS